MTKRVPSIDPSGPWLDELRGALDVEPSSELQARVRSRIRGERMRARQTAARLAGLLCVAAAATFALTPARRSTETPPVATTAISPAAEPATDTKTTIASIRPSASPRSAVHPVGFAGPRNRLTEGTPKSEPEVIVSGDQREGLRRILGALANGQRLRASAETDVSEALPAAEPMTIEPLYIAPLPGTPDPAVKGGRVP